MASERREEGDGHDTGDAKALLKAVFSPGYKFPQQDSDESMKADVHDTVTFGSLTNFIGPASESLCRHFLPGKYKVSSVKLHVDIPDYEDFCDPFIIYHHVKVDPNLLALQVIRMGYGYEAGVDENCINRYDWDGGCCADCDSEEELCKAEDAVEDCRQFIYFTPTEKSKLLIDCILKKRVEYSSVMENLISVKDENGQIISIAFQYSPLSSTGYYYGKLFQDIETNCCFALIINGAAMLEEGPWAEILSDEERKALGFREIDDGGLKFPMSDFLLNEN